MLDAAGLQQIRIFASSGLDEYEIAALLDAGAPIDGFGVGTGMSVSDDAPALDIVYKLAEYAGEGRTKLSPDKPILPGRKQIFRQEQDGRSIGDVIARADEQREGRPLLRCVMQAGRRMAGGVEDLSSVRRRAAEELSRLPPRVTAIGRADPPYAVSVSEALAAHHEGVRDRVHATSRS
jgi:nicotinate phosphoribosyltransferase